MSPGIMTSPNTMLCVMVEAASLVTPEGWGSFIRKMGTNGTKAFWYDPMCMLFITSFGCKWS